MRRRSFWWKAAPTIWVFLMVSASVAYAAVSFAGKTGKSEVRSKALGATIDVSMAVPSDGNCATATYVAGDLTTDLFSISDASSGQSFPTTTLCLRNAGARVASGVLVTANVQSVDEQCTGDEAAFDNTCGNSGLGELTQQLRLVARNCDTNAQITSIYSPDNWNPMSTQVSPGATTCVRIEAYWPAQGWQQETMSQTDLAAWRYQFNMQPA